MNLTELLTEPPKLHVDSSGQLVSWGISDAVLRFIDNHVLEGCRTLETGAGVSTILFALKGVNHICVVPDQAQVARIKEYCLAYRISLDNVDFIIDKSEVVLPRLDVRGLDLVLIDGRHAFPTPYIDWYYSSSALKIGGLLVIDDTELWSCDVLKQFLLSEPEWQLKQDFAPRSVAFVKVADGTHEKEWNQQAFVAAASLDLYRESFDMIGRYVDQRISAARKSKLRRILRGFLSQILKKI